MSIYSSPEFEEIWAEIKLILDWHSDFSLFFVLGQNTLSSTALRQRLQDYLRAITGPLNWIHPASPVDIDQQLAEQLFARPGPPVWLELGRQDSQGKWDRARQQALGLLNRRRSTLETAMHGPLFIELPEDFAAHIVTWAPDLWSIRQQLIELPAVRPVNAMDHQRNLVVHSDKHPHDPEKIHALRLKVEQLKNHHKASGNKPYKSRQLAIALSELGQALIQVQDLTGARQRINESLALLRDLQTALGDSPQVLRDLSVSLDRLGDVEQQSGRLEAARGAYEESLSLCRQLQAALGDSPQVLRDLSVSLEKLGDVERQSDRLEAARAAYDESLGLCRKLHAALGDSPQVLRDLSVSLDRLGNVEQQSGRLDAARAAYEESLTLCRQLQAALGDSPEVLCDLSVVLNKLGDVERQSGRLEAARGVYAEALELARRFNQLLDGSPNTMALETQPLEQKLARIAPKTL